MDPEHLLARLEVQLQELAAFRDARRTTMGPARFRAADGTEGTLRIGELWPSRAWPVTLAFDVEIPKAFRESARHGDAAIRLDVGGEGLLSVDGHPVGGLNPYHREYPLPRGSGATFSAEVEAVPKAPFAVEIPHPRLAEALLILPDRDVRALHGDLTAVVDAAAALADTRPDISALLADAAAETLKGVELPRDPTGAYLARLTYASAARDQIETVWEEWSFPDPPLELDDRHRATIVTARGVLTERIAAVRERYGTEGELWLSGHAHLDLAWLWPLAETRRKAQRTFRTVLGLLERYPDWTFNQSMAQLYAYLEQDDPDAFEQIRSRVADGRWEVVGGMWVEPDGNLLAGESWARQLLTGQRYLEDRLGARATVAWLPDTFGYAANLPQLLRQAGMRWFFTTKLNWSETNRFPHDLYWWEGLDGSRVLAHSFNNRQRNYNGVITGTDTTDVWRRFRGKRHAGASLFTFGWGDGGGGPTADMLERAQRQHDMPGLPHLCHGRVDEYYEMLEADVDTASLPVWVGEKYLEFHRGTYTTQAEIKKLHRRLEHALVDAETAATLAWWLGGTAYPGMDLASLWRVLLRNQFHDILPGSSVGTVNAEAVAELRETLDATERLADTSLARMAETEPGTNDRLMVWNLSLDHRPLHVRLPEDVRGVVFDGRSLPVQQLHGERWVHAPEIHVPGLGYTSLDVRLETGPGGSDASRVFGTEDRLENDILRVSVGADGSITIYDKQHGRFATSQPANVLWAHPDLPRDFEAWEIDADYAAAGTRLDRIGPVEVIAEGPAVAAVRVSRVGGGYEVETEYRLWASSRRLEMHTRVVSHGRRSLLRATFPTTVRTPRATFETAFGAVERPTHRNTPWDAAKFEVPGLRWADLSEPGYGVSLLTDSKYGYAAHGSELSLSLLRGPVYPDPHADRGEHTFVYAIYPHGGDWRTGTVAQAHDLNAPLRASRVSGSDRMDPSEATSFRAGDAKRSVRASSRSLVASTGDHVRLSALKRSEDGEKLVLRLYEPHGARGTARISGPLGLPTDRLDLLEERPRAVDDGSIAFGPYEVITLELQRGA